MLDSWQKDRKNRPKFAAVRNTIDRLMQSPELLRKLAKPITASMTDPEMPEVTSHMTVSQWLQLIKMDRYTEAFAQKGVHNMEQVILTIQTLGSRSFLSSYPIKPLIRYLAVGVLISYYII